MASFRGGIVFIEEDKEKVMELQKGHGDWDPRVTGVSQSHLICCLHNIGFKRTLWIGPTQCICRLVPAYGCTVTKHCAYFVFDQF